MKPIDRIRPWFAGLLLAALLPASPVAAAQMPTEPDEAMRQYEENIEDWNDGPVQYLFLPDEREIWGELEDDDERRRFIAWFWDRRDEELRDLSNPFKEGFYERVASANRRFTGLPRGWRSDRGRVWITLGQPGGMRASRGLDVWVYGNESGELRVSFSEIDPGNWEIHGEDRPGAWPEHILRTFEMVNNALIENPSLEFSK